MTEQPTIDTPPTAVTPEEGSRLQQLAALYPGAKAAAEIAARELKAITDGIKAELSAAAPGQTKVDLQGPGPALRLGYSETWRFDSTRFKAEDPETYVRYAKKSGSWTLKVLAGGQ